MQHGPGKARAWQAWGDLVLPALCSSGQEGQLPVLVPQLGPAAATLLEIPLEMSPALPRPVSSAPVSGQALQEAFSSLLPAWPLAPQWV